MGRFPAVSVSGFGSPHGPAANPSSADDDRGIDDTAGARRKRITTGDRPSVTKEDDAIGDGASAPGMFRRTGEGAGGPSASRGPDRNNRPHGFPAAVRDGAAGAASRRPGLRRPAYPHRHADLRQERLTAPTSAEAPGEESRVGPVDGSEDTAAHGSPSDISGHAAWNGSERLMVPVHSARAAVPR